MEMLCNQFTRVSFDNASMENSTWDDCDFQQVHFRQASLDKAKIRGNCSSTDFQGATGKFVVDGTDV